MAEETREEIEKTIEGEKLEREKGKKRIVRKVSPKILGLAALASLVLYLWKSSGNLDSRSFWVMLAIVWVAVYFYTQMAGVPTILTKQQAFKYMQDDIETQKLLDVIGRHDKVEYTNISSLDEVQGTYKKYRFLWMHKKADGLKYYMVGLVDAVTGNTTHIRFDYPIKGTEVPPIRYIPDQTFMQMKKFDFLRYLWRAK